MRRFIILSVVGLGLCVGGSTMADAAVFKTVSRKVIVERTVITKQIAPVHYEHLAVRHWDHSFRCYR